MLTSRRGFGKLAFAGALSGAPRLSAAQASESVRVPSWVPWDDPFAPGIKIGHRLRDDATDKDLAFYRKAGIECGSVLTSVENATYEWMSRMREFVEQRGARLLNVNIRDLHCDPTIVLGLDDVDRHIEQYQQFLINAGKAGLRYTTYGHMANLRMGYGSTGKGSARGVPSRVFDMAEAQKLPLSHGRVYTDEEIWETFTRFVKAVVPVAEEAGVRIGLHPDDPPVPSLGGVARVIRNFEGYQRAMEIADSDNFGLCFCAGTWAEGGEAMGKSVIEMIRYFGPKKKIFKVHFRNVDRPLPRFQETFVDDGYMDMYQVMKELRKVNFNGVVVPDHVPGEGNRGGPNTAYMIGYMRALRDAVNGEFGSA